MDPVSSSSERASKPLASALGNSLAVLLEESIAPLRDMMYELSDRVEALEETSVGFGAALGVQTKALDQALPQLAQCESTLAALASEFQAEFDALHGKHDEHTAHVATRIDESFSASAEAAEALQLHQTDVAELHRSHATSFQAHQTEVAGLHQSHEDKLEAHRAEMMAHHASQLESHADSHADALGSHTEQHTSALESLRQSHAEALRAHQEHHAEAVEGLRNDHESHKLQITEALSRHASDLESHRDSSTST